MKVDAMSDDETFVAWVKYMKKRRPDAVHAPQIITQREMFVWETRQWAGDDPERQPAVLLAEAEFETWKAEHAAMRRWHLWMDEYNEAKRTA